MGDISLMYWSEKHGKTQPRILTFTWEITAAVTVSEKPQGIPVLYSFGAITQAQIDAFLTTPYSTSSSEFDADAFDATSMGTDAFGGIIDMRGQAADVLWIKSECNLDPTTDGALFNSDVSVSALSTSALANNIEVARSSAGNLAFKQTVTGLDAATNGIIKIDIGWISN